MAKNPNGKTGNENFGKLKLFLSDSETWFNTEVLVRVLSSPSRVIRKTIAVFCKIIRIHKTTEKKWVHFGKKTVFPSFSKTWLTREVLNVPSSALHIIIVLIFKKSKFSKRDHNKCRKKFLILRTTQNFSSKLSYWDTGERHCLKMHPFGASSFTNFDFSAYIFVELFRGYSQLIRTPLVCLVCVIWPQSGLSNFVCWKCCEFLLRTPELLRRHLFSLPELQTRKSDATWTKHPNFWVHVFVHCL